ncbi:glycosyltransferase family 4 protein [Terrabacter aerolatus]|uniref:D-inositol 3-phosphate glycosyltransferase n=2 Tax=Terrabacter aerolatus TaxID=422442 RepID=A0A512D3N4_9MICO|nr:glycosyltransferase WbuB [Terrabacter aerolatus]
MSDRARVLIIVQNLSVPMDRRVWLECQALVAEGHEVSVICPKGPGDAAHEELAGVHIRRYRPAPPVRGALGYAYEFAYSWLRTALLSVKVHQRCGFDVIQACNPPDTYWLLARLWRRSGVRFVYDQHDLNPELFLSRFGTPKGLSGRIQYRGLLWLERQTYKTADHVISTNESYASIARSRGGKAPEQVSVVRSGPDTSRMKPEEPDLSLREGADSLLVYLGIMGPQDDVDQLLLVMDELVNRRGRGKVRLALLGFGDCLDELKAQAIELGLEGNVQFTGRVGLPDITRYLSTADIGLGPDLKTPLNDLSTMNKTMEYMAYGLPTISFDLREVRCSAGEVGIYVESGDVAAFADEVEKLLDDPQRRARLGALGRQRAEDVLDWRAQAAVYTSVYSELGAGQSSASGHDATVVAESMSAGD